MSISACVRVNNRINYIICKVYHSLETIRKSVTEENIDKIISHSMVIPRARIRFAFRDLSMRIVGLCVWKRHQWTHAERDHANHARSYNTFPCALIPASASVITSVVERHIQSHKLNPFKNIDASKP